MSTILHDFVDWYSNGIKTEHNRVLSTFNTRDYVSQIESSIGRQFTQVNKPRDYIGASGLGKPIVLLGLQKLGFPYLFNSPTIKTHVTFHFGDLFEEMVFYLMDVFGIKITKQQEQVIIPGTSVMGHIDGYLPKLDAVIEIKTMSSSYYKTFVKSPNDYRSYFTQLAVYTNCLRASRAFWICFNKETSEIAVVEPDYEELSVKAMYAYEKAKLLNDINSLEDLALLTPPSPKAEVYRKEETGRFLIPPSMLNTPYLEAWYHLEQGKDGYGKKKTYVSSVETDANKIKNNILTISNKLKSTYDNS